MALKLTRSIRDYETLIDFVQGPPGSRRERVKNLFKCMESIHCVLRGESGQKTGSKTP